MSKKMGRPKLPEKEKKVKLMLSLSPNLVDLLNKSGNRSKAVNDFLTVRKQQFITFIEKNFRD